MHNLIVGLFAMADLTVKSTVAYLSNIKDPFYLLLEFCLRYALYRNFIIEVQVILNYTLGKTYLI